MRGRLILLVGNRRRGVLRVRGPAALLGNGGDSSSDGIVTKQFLSNLTCSALGPGVTCAVDPALTS